MYVDAFLRRFVGGAAAQVVIAIVVVCTLLHDSDTSSSCTIGMHNLQLIGCGRLLLPVKAATCRQE